ncbi:protein FAR1-RELATED SEQUENCE 5-like [Juglans regia]|uniref:Protein FAR1-RELATED SEQUENCE n=1 Tax=Juglans regia TaxID=51240 RepID=A0A6P9F8R9_JUGRE|nr:protein FAR1-RELATED SEQUENCE 5-like [Juglans regia]
MTQRSKREKDVTIKYVTLGCARGGNAQNRTSNVSKPRPTRKTDCKAGMNVLLKNGKLCVTSVFNTHNHVLSPRKSRFFRCNREVSESVKRVLDTNDEAGIWMNKSFQAIVTDVGGFENVPFGEKNCRNYIDKARHLQLEKGSAQALLEYFRRLQYKNDGFYGIMDLDDDRMRNVFWVDARSRGVYNYFGDVVTFDTAYLTNRYGMPFAPFMGVNHHGQSILLGAGLISSENTESFVWLFKTWLDCMDGKAPNTIITDQYRVMKNAIAIVFPNTRHRYCLWHILRKVPEKLGSYNQYKCGLKKREFWVPVYLKNSFWAGMSTTQHSESMNAFFDGYVHAKTNLKEFVDQFDSALKKKIENENQTDFHSYNFTIPLISHLALEKKFQEVYTNAKFREVYCTMNPHSVASNVGLSTVHATTEGSSKKVLSPHVVRGKGRPPTKRRMSMMEEKVKKIKTKAAKNSNDKGKSKPRWRRLDTELLESSGNQTFVITNQETVQTSVQLDGTQPSMAERTQSESRV